MKRIYISLPITGHEDTYEERLQELATDKNIDENTAQLFDAFLSDS